MSLTIYLSIRQRLNCMNVIRSQRKKPDAELDDLRTLHGLWRKVRLEEDQERLFVFAIPGVGEAFNRDALRRSDHEEPFQVELENAEARRLRTLLMTVCQPNVEDLDWWDPLIEQLKEIK